MNILNYMEQLHCWWGSEMVQLFCKNSLLERKKKHTFTYDPVISPLDIHLRKIKIYIYTKT